MATPSSFGGGLGAGQYPHLQPIIASRTERGEAIPRAPGSSTRTLPHHRDQRSLPPPAPGCSSFEASSAPKREIASVGRPQRGWGPPLPRNDSGYVLHRGSWLGEAPVYPHPLPLSRCAGEGRYGVPLPQCLARHLAAPPLPPSGGRGGREVRAKTTAQRKFTALRTERSDGPHPQPLPAGGGALAAPSSFGRGLGAGQYPHLQPVIASRAERGEAIPRAPGSARCPNATIAGWSFPLAPKIASGAAPPRNDSGYTPHALTPKIAGLSAVTRTSNDMKFRAQLPRSPIDSYPHRLYNAHPVEPIDRVIRAPRYVRVTGFASGKAPGTRNTQHRTPSGNRRHGDERRLVWKTASGGLV